MDTANINFSHIVILALIALTLGEAFVNAKKYASITSKWYKKIKFADVDNNFIVLLIRIVCILMLGFSVIFILRSL